MLPGCSFCHVFVKLIAQQVSLCSFFSFCSPVLPLSVITISDGNATKTSCGAAYWIVLSLTRSLAGSRPYLTATRHGVTVCARARVLMCPSPLLTLISIRRSKEWCSCDIQMTNKQVVISSPPWLIYTVSQPDREGGACQTVKRLVKLIHAFLSFSGPVPRPPHICLLRLFI